MPLTQGFRSLYRVRFRLAAEPPTPAPSIFIIQASRRRRPSESQGPRLTLLCPTGKESVNFAVSVSTLRVYVTPANRKKLPGILVAPLLLKTLIIWTAHPLLKHIYILTASVPMVLVVQSVLQLMSNDRVIAQESKESILLVTIVSLFADTLDSGSHWPR